MTLKDKVAIVTGAASGIGKGISLCFAERGATVIVVDINLQKAKGVAKQIKCGGVPSLAIEANVASSSDVQRVVEYTLRNFNKISVLVNNAGINYFHPLLEVPEKEWDEVIAVNLKGTFLFSQAVARQMVKQREGKIINIASIAGMTAFPNQPHYCASKAAVISLTKTTARELAPYHIGVNAISPGVTKNGQTKGLLASTKERKRILNNIPWGRVGEVKDIGKAAVFLASDWSDYITGEILVVDGGWLA